MTERARRAPIQARRSGQPPKHSAKKRRLPRVRWRGVQGWLMRVQFTQGHTSLIKLPRLQVTKCARVMFLDDERLSKAPNGLCSCLVAGSNRFALEGSELFLHSFQRGIAGPS